MDVGDKGGRRPLVFVGVVSGAFFGVFLGVFTHLANGARDVWPSVLLGAVAGVLFGVSFAWIVSRLRRGMGGATRSRSLIAAIRSGVLPESVDDTWLEALEFRRKQALLYRWLNPLIFVLLSGLGVASLVRSLVPAWLGWAEIAIFVVAGVASLVQSHRELRAIAALKTRLAARA